MWRTCWRAIGVQAVAVVCLFALLVALPLREGFFRDWGLLTGPLAWTGCALLTARLLSLPLGRTLVAALLGGLVGLATLVTVGHTAAMAAALLAFGAACGVLDTRGSEVFTFAHLRGDREHLGAVTTV